MAARTTAAMRVALLPGSSAAVEFVVPKIAELEAAFLADDAQAAREVLQSITDAGRPDVTGAMWDAFVDHLSPQQIATRFTTTSEE